MSGRTRRPDRWIRLLVAAAAIALVGCDASREPPPGPPNVVILSIDTLRPDHLGLYGYPRDTSPYLDDLARRSAVFDQAVTVHVTTAPAHASIMTGRSPAGHGIRRNGMRLADGVPTLAEVLSARGWSTGAFVSGWTLQRHTGLDRGFDRYDDDLGPPRSGARRAGAATVDAAVRWLSTAAEGRRPFFLFVHLFEPHWPYDPPTADAIRFLAGQSALATSSYPVHLDRLAAGRQLSPADRREYVARYDGEIAVADRLVRRLLDAVDRLGVAETTVVVVLSDHGETLFEREWTMDHGARPYDEQARVPLVMHLPEDPSRGRRIADQVSLLDVAPTVFDLVGIDGPPLAEGRTLLPLLRETNADVRPVFVTARAEPARVPHVPGPLLARGLVRAVRLPDLKLVEYPKGHGEWHRELFDLADDPDELSNLADSRPELADTLHDLLDRWQIATGSGEPVAAPELDAATEAALRELGYIDN